MPCRVHIMLTSSTTLNTSSSLNQTKPFLSQRHPFHILDASPFPFLTGLFLLSLLVPLTFSLHGVDLFGLPRAEMIHASFFGLFLTAMTWFTSIILESSQGYHTKRVQEGLRMGMLLFILSEVMLFFAFFWGFFHVSLVPAVSIGNVWPPTDTQPLDMWGLPLVNTLLLLTSGVTITLGHAELVKGNTTAFFWQLFLTILLGTVFLFCQAYEYQYGVLFSFRDNIYGSIFFITTGFHGMHVTIGTLFLLYCATRHLLTAPTAGDRSRATFSFTPGHHFGFEAAAWYWHFVDVVWLFLFLSIYWWGGK